MSIREQLNENPKIVVAIVAVVVVAAAAWIFWPSGTGAGGSSQTVSEMFFTTDEGKTFTVGPYTKIAQAGTVRAHVFRYEGEKPFVGYLETHTPAGKKLLSDFYASAENHKQPPPETLAVLAETMVKKPGTGQWVNLGKQGELALQITQMPRKGQDLPTRLSPDMIEKK